MKNYWLKLSAWLDFLHGLSWLSQLRSLVSLMTVISACLNENCSGKFYGVIWATTKFFSAEPGPPPLGGALIGLISSKYLSNLLLISFLDEGEKLRPRERFQQLSTRRDGGAITQQTTWSTSFGNKLMLVGLFVPGTSPTWLKFTATIMPPANYKAP